MKIQPNYNFTDTSILPKYTNKLNFNASPVTIKNTADYAVKCAGGLLVLAMFPNINNSLQSNTVTSPLGESLSNPSFPVEFNKKDFIEWASRMKLGYEVKYDAVEFKDKFGNIVRRIVQDKNNIDKVKVDRIWIYDKGTEAAKFVKFADKNVKYYYNRMPDGIYNNMAELKPDGIWYDRYGEIMEFNPLTNQPQIGFKKANVFLGESLKNPAFPVDFDILEFNKWAKSLNLPAPVIEDGVAKFYNYEDKLVRQINEQKEHKGKVQDDYIYIYDDNGILSGMFASYTAISSRPMYKYGRTVNGTFRYMAQLGQDGLWHPFGRNWNDILPNNPVTGEPQLKNN